MTRFCVFWKLCLLVKYHILAAIAYVETTFRKDFVQVWDHRFGSYSHEDRFRCFALCLLEFYVCETRRYGRAWLTFFFFLFCICTQNERKPVNVWTILATYIQKVQKFISRLAMKDFDEKKPYMYLCNGTESLSPLWIQDGKNLTAGIRLLQSSSLVHKGRVNQMRAISYL